MILQPATLDEKPRISALMQPYLQELSAFTRIDHNKNGFEYPYLDFYWETPDRYPYLILDHGEKAGFLLIREYPDPGDGELIREIAELYVLPAFRRGALASQAVTEVFEKFPGRWLVGVLKGNTIAQRFWRELISRTDKTFSSEQLAEDGQTVYRFNT